MRALLDALRSHPARRRRVRWAAAAVAAVAIALGTLALGRPSSRCDGGDALADALWDDGRRSAVADAFGKHAPGYGDAALAAVDVALTRWRDGWSRSHVDTCRAHERDALSDTRHDRRMLCLEAQRRQALALVAALAGVEDAAAVARAPEAVAELDRSDRCTTLAGDRPASQLGAAFSAALAEVRAHHAVGRFADAARGARDLVARADEASDDPARHEAHALLARASLELGELTDADTHALSSLRAAERSGDDRGAVEGWLLLAAISGTRGRYREAEERCRHAEALLSRVPDELLRARVLNALGVIDTNLGRHAGARAALDEALRLRTAAHGEQHLEVSRTLTNLGNLARASGDIDAALTLHRRAQAIDAALLGQAHPAQARHLHNLARVALLRGDTAGAESLYQRALDLSRRALGDDHPSLGLSENSLGLLHEQTGDAARAETHYRRAVALLAPSRPADAAAALHNLGKLLLRRNDSSAALAELDKALAITRSLLGDSHERVAELSLAVALAQLASGDARAAQASLQRVIAMALLNPDAKPHATTAETLLAAQAAPPTPGPTPLPRPPVTPAPPPPPPPGGSYVSGQAWD